jgi:AraC-like DNA-binding protein
MTASATLRCQHVLTGMAILRERGIDPLPLCRQAGISDAALADSETLLPVAAVGAFIVLAGEAAGTPNLGLLIGERGGGPSMGPLSAVIAHAATMREAVRTFSALMRAYRRGLLMRVVEADDIIVLEVRLLNGSRPGMHLLSDGAMIVMADLLRRLAGSLPVMEARFPYRRPADVRDHARLFPAPLVFDADDAALVLPASWLETRIDPARPEVRELRSLGPARPVPPLRLADRVVQALRADPAASWPDQAIVAGQLGVGVRALHRGLAAEGTSFRALLDALRHEKAREMLRATTMNLAQVAEALGYADASTFARAFRRLEGVSPSAWRTGAGQSGPRG